MSQAKTDAWDLAEPLGKTRWSLAAVLWYVPSGASLCACLCLPVPVSDSFCPGSVDKKTSTKPRGSSIDDITGCTVTEGEEKFTFSGTYYLITLERRGHPSLPDLQDGSWSIQPGELSCRSCCSLMLQSR